MESAYLRPVCRRRPPLPTWGRRVSEGAGARATRARRGFSPTSILPPVPPVKATVPGVPGVTKDLFDACAQTTVGTGARGVR